MKKTEKLEEFSQRSTKRVQDMVGEPKIEHFGIFTRDNCPLTSAYGRRNFYKVALVLDPGKLFYADRWVDIDRPALQFSNPMIPYAWENEVEDRKGWFCLFNEEFLYQGERSGTLKQNPFFKAGGLPVFFLESKEELLITGIFQNMLEEFNSDYTYKYDVLRNYLHIVMHQAIKLKPSEDYRQYGNSASRMTSLFLELLDRQFPVDPAIGLVLRSAQDYAENLSVHVNSLNRALKDITGKTTSEYINHRIIQEAVYLLKQNQFNISEIAYMLGFQEPNNFTSYFKKHTGTSPSSVRNS
ncbi:helix-turn-helix domain-containing protein [Chryseobacterium culicis]|nr:helix-turn-helix transcriptional regulator [Chryseobacterium culicis]